MVEWLRDAAFYEIYPQSFYDTNGDGIGDLQGIIEKLDYIKELGCNALWINPIYDSPFKDAGYDVRDYLKVAPRYGTNEDAYRLFEEAHARGMHVLLDLVPGHTSEEHAWFRESGREEKNVYSDRYIWTDFWLYGTEGHPYIGGECERNGTYMLNFFKCQPALNYGFRTPKWPWQQAIDAPGPMATRTAMQQVMEFWLRHGADGFRVDMADSLVKDDDAEKSGTCEVWRDLFGRVRKNYPQAAFVAEWSNPELAIGSAGFDMDFYLDHTGNGYNALVRDYERGKEDQSYFKMGSGGQIETFLADYLPRLEAAQGKGYISMISGNHDCPRIRRTLSIEEMKRFYALLYTLPGVPFLYYGDEIGMRYLELPTKEGGYTRTGTRTPMQWDRDAGYGFSTAPKSAYYLPVDESTDAPNVKDAMRDETSLWHIVQGLLSLRHAQPDLQADGDFEVLSAKGRECFVYRRGRLVCVLVPENGCHRVKLPQFQGKQIIYQLGEAVLAGDELTMHGGFAVLK